MNRAFKHAKHFTLAEMMTVILIIAILATIGFVIIGKTQDDAYRATTLATINNLYVAIESYKMETGHYPTPDSGNGYGIREGNSGNRILNSKFRKYFTYSDKDIDSSGYLLDAWGKRLRYKYLESMYNVGILYNSNPNDDTGTDVQSIPKGGLPKKHEIVIYSVGANGDLDGDDNSTNPNYNDQACSFDPDSLSEPDINDQKDDVYITIR